MLFKSFLFDSNTNESIKHCSDGPAIIDDDKGIKEWWIEGKQITEEEHNKYLKNRAFW
jgi:hypothetical protein